MPGARRGPKAVVFDFDEVLLDSRKAWQYALEEGIAMVCGYRVDGAPLVPEYRQRPWRHAVTVVVPEPDARTACEQACRRIYERGAQKRLLVHEGVGMCLDAIRSAHIDMGVVSREPHAIAIKQLQSTGLDRFMTVLAPTPPDTPWDVAARFAECLSFLRYDAGCCAFVSGDGFDLQTIEQTGACGVLAAWAGKGGGSRPTATEPAMLGPVLVAAGATGD